MNRAPEVGMDHLTLLDVSPPDLVTIAREAGFDSVSLRVAASTPREEPWPMSAGSPMPEDTARRLDDTGVSVLSAEVVRIEFDTNREDYEPALEAGARLGARYVTVNSDDPNIQRASETFATLTAEARPYGLRPLIEPIIYTRVSNLDEAIYIGERSGGGGYFWTPCTSNATAVVSSGYAQWTGISFPTCSFATRHWLRHLDCRVLAHCRVGSPPTAPTCNWRAAPCACCRETVSCRWRSSSPRYRKESPSASKLPSCRYERPKPRLSSPGVPARR
jgi:hypothetical protein